MAIEIIPRKGKEEATPFQGKLFRIGLVLITLLVLSSLLFYFFKWISKKSASLRASHLHEKK